MANIMNMVNLKNSVSRNGFDLSKKVNFTAKAGELLPIYSTHVLPGDKFTVDLKSFTRTKPVNTAAYARMREYYDFYFVPYELLWNRAFTVLTQMTYQQQHADALISDGEPLSDEVPYFTCEQIAHYIYNVAHYTTNNADKNFAGFSRAKQTVKLLEYLNYGNFEDFVDADWEEGVNQVNTNFDLNVFKLLAYQKIYADYFRDQQWEKVDPSTFNMDYMTGKQSMNVAIPADTSGQNAGFYDNYNMFDLRYCNWMKDMFHGILPQAQYGDTSVVPLSASGSLNLPNLSVTGINAASTPLFKGETGGSDPDLVPVLANRKTGRVYFERTNDNGGTPGSLYWDDPQLQTVAKSVSSVQLDSGLSILALRQYEFLQKWKEIAQSGRQDYKDMVQKIWNVSVGDGYSETCEYLGGCVGDMSINEVINSNLVDGSEANIAGKGTGVSNGKISFDSRGRYGVFMCIYHCVPVVDYTTDFVDPLDTKVNAADFANPIFDKVGMQPVYRNNMDNSWHDDIISNRPMGYAPRYIEYKTSIDQSIGDFKRSLKYWVVSYNYADFVGLGNQFGAGSDDDNAAPQPPIASAGTEQVTYAFFKIIPQLLDPIFAQQATEDVSSDQFLVSSFLDIKAVRNLDTNGLPY